MPRFLANCFRPAEEHKDNPASGFDPLKVLYPHGREGYLAFHKQMGRWAPLLEEFGIGVSRRKHASSYRSRESGEIERRMTTHWTIERPRWKKREDLFTDSGLSVKDLTVMVMSWMADTD